MRICLARVDASRPRRWPLPSTMMGAAAEAREGEGEAGVRPTAGWARCWVRHALLLLVLVLLLG